MPCEVRWAATAHMKYLHRVLVDHGRLSSVSRDDCLELVAREQTATEVHGACRQNGLHDRLCIGRQCDLREQSGTVIRVNMLQSPSNKISQQIPDLCTHSRQSRAFRHARRAGETL